MSFRFGNNGTVACDTAMLVPVGPIWLKIAFVPSTTPFLISNNAFRQLNAVIYTAQQKVVFERLGCEVPLKLSDRKLFIMDICDLIRSVLTQSSWKRSEQLPSPINDQTVLHTIKDDDRSNNLDQIEEPVSKVATGSHVETEAPCQPVSAQSASDRIASSKVVPVDHHVVGQPISKGSSRPEGRGRNPGPQPCHLRRAPESRGAIWKGQDWTALPSSCPRRPRLGSMVCRPLCQLNQAISHGVHQVHRDVRREDGSQSRNASRPNQEGQQEGRAEKQVQDC